ncbi:hypothetical protein [Nonomuraea pusilla]|uniref:Excreted virulence factor EspC, type VII ESX diderm n=1 Tax=Nonomuraea pusilla TaxID=46177 RepID=A0A1H7V9I8_9ACTN|nr:hypothetical protein [Nonomuraea pusilla]SEM05684.1 hypothetical protein SAMN05660976_04044 [Nonomuraea pusilla]
MATGLDIHFSALDDCRIVARTVRGKFGDLADGYPARSPDSSIFGRLDDSGALADAVHLVETTADSEFGKAKSLIEGVETALGQVQDNVRRANDPR